MKELTIRAPLHGQTMAEVSAVVRQFSLMLDLFPTLDCETAMGLAVFHSTHTNNYGATMTVLDPSELSL